METIKGLLKAYQNTWPLSLVPYPGLDPSLEKKLSAAMLDFIERRGEEALLRSCDEGHLTASALVVSPNFDKVLLMLHAKLGKWLQLGGHVDGDKDLSASALREAREESGRNEITLYRWEECVLGERYSSPLPFDIDIHEIPARKAETAHLHFDLRFLCLLDDKLIPERNEESHDLRWLTLAEARELTDEPSMLRQFAKLESIRLTCRQFRSDLSLRDASNPV